MVQDWNAKNLQIGMAMSSGMNIRRIGYFGVNQEFEYFVLIHSGTFTALAALDHSLVAFQEHTR